MNGKNQSTTKKSNKGSSSKNKPLQKATNNQTSSNQRNQATIVRPRRGKNKLFNTQNNNQIFGVNATMNNQSPVKTNQRMINPPIIQHFDERVGVVGGTTSFYASSFQLNPGNPELMPWFSKIASLFERYRFRKLEFYFLRDVSQYNTQGQAGQAYMSAFYDAVTPTPTGSQQIVDSQPYVSFMAHEDAVLRLSPNGMHPTGQPLFVLSGANPTGTDPKTYNCGQLLFSTEGFNVDGAILGFLHVRGTCELYTRILSAPSSDQLAPFSGGDAQAAGIDFADYPFAILGVSPNTTNLQGITYIPNGANSGSPSSLIFNNPGYYNVWYACICSDTTGSILVNIAADPEASIDAVYAETQEAISGSNAGTYGWRVIIKSVGGSIALLPTNTSGGGAPHITTAVISIGTIPFPPTLSKRSNLINFPCKTEEKDKKPKKEKKDFTFMSSTRENRLSVPSCHNQNNQRIRML